MIAILTVHCHFLVQSWWQGPLTSHTSLCVFSQVFKDKKITAHVNIRPGPESGRWSCVSFQVRMHERCEFLGDKGAANWGHLWSIQPDAGYLLVLTKHTRIPDHAWLSWMQVLCTKWIKDVTFFLSYWHGKLRPKKKSFYFKWKFFSLLPKNILNNNNHCIYLSRLY